MTIKARESLGTRYTLHLKMPASEEAPEAGEHLLDDVIVLLDVTSSEVRRIVTASWRAGERPASHRTIGRPVKPLIFI